MKNYQIVLPREACFNLVISCEHAGNVVPKEYLGAFKKHEELLHTHRGLDIGALAIAKFLAKSMKAPLIYCSITRLLVELNRSLGNKSLFFLPLKECEQNQILMKYYFPYRHAVEGLIERGKKVVHLSIHSFTPILNGVERNADIGLLYDPKRASEKAFCETLGRKIGQCSDYKVRYNYPYKGTSDGLTVALRKKYGPERYVGVEIEVNQKIVREKAVHKVLRDCLW